MKTEGKIGSNIKRIRIAKGVKAVEIAKALGVSRSKISLIESGERGLRPEELQAIAIFLNVPTSELYGEAPQTTASERLFAAIGEMLPEKEAQTIEKLCSTQEGRDALAEWISRFASISREKRLALVEILKTD